MQEDLTEMPEEISSSDGTSSISTFPSLGAVDFYDQDFLMTASARGLSAFAINPFIHPTYCLQGYSWNRKGSVLDRSV